MNQSNDSIWMSMRLGTSRMEGSLENDVRGLGVVLRLKRGHSSLSVWGLHWPMRNPGF